MAAPVVVTVHICPDLNSAMWLSDREVDHCQVVLGEQAVEITDHRRFDHALSAPACTGRTVMPAGSISIRVARSAGARRSGDPAARILGRIVQILRQALRADSPVRRVVTLDAERSPTPGWSSDRCQSRSPISSVADQAQ